MEAMTRYNSIEGASGIVSDQDVIGISGFYGLFTGVQGVGVSKNTIIRTNTAISFRFNSLTNPQISIAAYEKFECDWLNVSKIFVTAAETANLKIIVAS